MTDHPNRITIDTHPSDMRTALSDAIADLLHIHGGDQATVLLELGVALQAAPEHYAIEASAAEGDIKIYTQARQPIRCTTRGWRATRSRGCWSSPKTRTASSAGCCSPRMQ